MTGDWIGTPFPEFELESLDGHRWSAEHLRGNRAVLFCFASW